MATVTLRARTTREAELRYTPSGKAVAELNLAENHRRKNQSGEWEDSGTTWWRGKAFGRTAEAIAEAVQSKGVSLLLSGRSETEEWEKRDGSKGSTLVLLIDEWAVIPRSGFTSAPQTASNGYQAPVPTDGAPNDPWAADGAWNAPSEPPF